jgi:ACS family glucarate transporter-like MFS transporter
LILKISAGRATIAITGPVLSKDLGLSPVQMGFIFSAFGWADAAGQVPDGWLLDRFGSKAVYFWSIPKHQGEASRGEGPGWEHLKQLIGNRMMPGIYLRQYCINTLTYFFITWFPVYLVQQRGMSILNAGIAASVPAICGFAGGVLGGVWPDFMLRRKWPLTVARKTPIITGMLLSTSMIICNDIDEQWLAVAVMALSFFGKGIGALGWAVVSDTCPKEIAGLSGGLFNMFGNISSITTPIVIRYLIQNTGSFNGALIFAGANAVAAAFSYLVIAGEIKRMQLKVGPGEEYGARSIERPRAL